jgi:hypothetical protein
MGNEEALEGPNEDQRKELADKVQAARKAYIDAQFEYEEFIAAQGEDQPRGET